MPPLHPSLPYHGGAILSPPIPASSGLYLGVDDVAAVQQNTDLRDYVTTTGNRTGQSLASPIMNQEQTSSCTAHAGAQVRNALSARYHLERGEAPDVGDTPSPRFAYYWIRHIDGSFPQDAGASMSAASRVYVDYGVSPSRFWPWDAHALNTPPSVDATAAAQSYGISGYARLSGQGSSLLASILQCLADGYPPHIAFSVYMSFETTGSDGRVPLPHSGETVLGGHDVACFASFADASFPGGGCLVIANSWGTGWAQNGYCYMPWQYVLSGIVSEAWTLR